ASPIRRSSRCTRAARRHARRTGLRPSIGGSRESSCPCCSSMFLLPNLSFGGETSIQSSIEMEESFQIAMLRLEFPLGRSYYPYYGKPIAGRILLMVAARLGYPISRRVGIAVAQSATSDLVAAAAATAAGVTGLDVVESTPHTVIIDVSADTRDVAHAQEVSDALEELPGV